jgi:hypothetical protein
MINPGLNLEKIALPMLMLTLLACTGNNGTTSTTGGGGTGGGGTGGEGGAGGGPVYPVCMDNSTVFTGMIDDQPYDQVISSHNLGFDQGATPPR